MRQHYAPKTTIFTLSRTVKEWMNEFNWTLQDYKKQKKEEREEAEKIASGEWYMTKEQTDDFIAQAVKDGKIILLY